MWLNSIIYYTHASWTKQIKKETGPIVRIRAPFSCGLRFLRWLGKKILWEVRSWELQENGNLRPDPEFQFYKRLPVQKRSSPAQRRKYHNQPYEKKSWWENPCGLNCSGLISTDWIRQTFGKWIKQNFSKYGPCTESIKYYPNQDSANDAKTTIYNFFGRHLDPPLFFVEHFA